MNRTLSVQENIRITPELKNRFDAAVKQGNYCKSKIIRTLLEQWVVNEEVVTQ